MPKAETKLEMIRHFAEQDARISKQRALIARMSDYDLPTVQATSLLEDMESVRPEIQQADRDRLTK